MRVSIPMTCLEGHGPTQALAGWSRGVDVTVASELVEKTFRWLQEDYDSFTLAAGGSTGSRWIDWGTRAPDGHKVALLWSRWPADEP